MAESQVFFRWLADLPGLSYGQRFTKAGLSACTAGSLLSLLLLRVDDKFSECARPHALCSNLGFVF
jgi:hypothetical protein